jgi:hypothetical protein
VGSGFSGTEPGTYGIRQLKRAMFMFALAAFSAAGMPHGVKGSMFNKSKNHQSLVPVDLGLVLKKRIGVKPVGVN